MFKRLEIPTSKPLAQKLIELVNDLLEDSGLPKVDQLHTSARVSELAGKGLPDGDLTPDEVKELCGSVMAHIKAHEAAKAK